MLDLEIFRWIEVTTNKDLFRIRLFPGHHNFPSECQDQVLQCLREDFKIFQS
jgi:surfactin synthase thioesterase subunit